MRGARLGRWVCGGIMHEPAPVGKFTHRRMTSSSDAHAEAAGGQALGLLFQFGAGQGMVLQPAGR